MDSTFISAVVLLFLVCDPFGNVPIFVSALRDVPHERRRRVILRECVIAFAVLTTFVFVGRPFLDLLGLSEQSLQIGGAVVLMLVAIRMVFPTADGVYGQPPGGEPFIVPLAIPALAGPSALATVLLFTSGSIEEVMVHVAALAAVALIWLAVFLGAERLQNVLGTQVMTAFERLMGLILTAMSIEMLLGGVRAFVKTL
jgi:MarC family membrane protein